MQELRQLVSTPVAGLVAFSCTATAKILCYYENDVRALLGTLMGLRSLHPKWHSLTRSK